MIKYLPIILICHASVPQQDCKVDTKDVTSFTGEPQNSPMACAIEGQTRLAQIAIAPKLNEPYYYKVRCVVREMN